MPRPTTVKYNRICVVQSTGPSTTSAMTLIPSGGKCPPLHLALDPDSETPHLHWAKLNDKGSWVVARATSIVIHTAINCIQHLISSHGLIPLRFCNLLT